MNNEITSEQIAKYVAQNRSFSSSPFGHSSDGEFGIYGYPTIMHSDFFLPWLINIRVYITNDDWIKFNSWQDMLMDSKMLIDFYQIVERYREPLRNEYIEFIKTKNEDKKKKIEIEKLLNILKFIEFTKGK